MKIRLDKELCTGHGRCYVLAPEVYESDDDGYGVPRFDRPPPEFVERARRAALNCPEDAITVIEDD